MKESLGNKALSDESIPAPMIVLKRIGIRVFPDGRHVAMYQNDKYGLVFTVPFGSASTQGVHTVQPTNLQQQHHG